MKGFFTQGVCVLTNGRPAVEDIKSALREHGLDVVEQHPAGEDLCFFGPTLLLPFKPEVNGFVAVDVVNQPWPDTMGDPKSDPTTFGAWSMGFYGPFASPGSLARAKQQLLHWQPASSDPESHRGFVRIRTSYVLGREGKAPVLPRDYDPLSEMMFVSRIVLALLTAPGAIYYFNPNGEVLRDRQSFGECWNAGIEQEKMPLDLWMSVRHFDLSDELSFMDSVGNSQLDISDVEAIFPKAEYDPNDVHYYLRNVTHYLLDTDREIQTNEAIDGPGESGLSWTVEVLEDGLIQPQRRVLRLYPQACREAVQKAVKSVGRPSM